MSHTIDQCPSSPGACVHCLEGMTTAQYAKWLSVSQAKMFALRTLSAVKRVFRTSTVPDPPDLGEALRRPTEDARGSHPRSLPLRRSSSAAAHSRISRLGSGADSARTKPC